MDLGVSAKIAPVLAEVRSFMEREIAPLEYEYISEIAVGGTPDIRIVLYRSVPVMAMVRLPTQASRGRANLHQGAVAAGVGEPRVALTGGCF